jgi:hypothetical protein
MHAMPDRPRPALGLAVGLAALLLSGCGGSGTRTGAAGASAATTKARFVAQAEAVCRALSAQEQPLKARQESLKGLPVAEADKAFVSLARRVVSLSRAAEGKLQALPRPPDDAQAIEKLLTSFSEETADANDIANAAASRESTLGEGAEQALRRSIAANSALADAYGMKACIGSE